jgi:thiol-disulfide isomerase/thioredoxin
MKQYLRIITALLVVAAGCKSQSQPVKMPSITIQGYIPHFKGDSVYIAQANNFDDPLYWAKVRDGHFTFTINDIDIGKEPFLASLGYRNDTGRIKLFHCKNEVLSPDETKYLYSAFYIDTTTIFIKEDAVKTHYIIAQTGQETKALYRTQMMEFGALDNDAAKRAGQLELYRGIIKQYPRSYYLLSKLNENKVLIKKAELESLLQCFAPGFVEQKAGQRFKEYLAQKRDVPVFANIQLPNEQQVPTDMIDAQAAVNMVVFWASWCGPCRREIPDLKALQRQYAPRGLVITSVSIDEKTEDWRAAMAQEQMPWRQLLVSPDKKLAVGNQFEVGAVPYTLFIDGKGKLIQRFVGIEKDSQEKYRKLLDSLLPR